MKIIKICFLFISILLSLSAYSQVTVTGTAFTEIVPVATVKETIQFNAGRFSVVADGGSITITPEGTRLAKGSVMLLDGPFSQGGFTMSGSENNSFSILLPGTPQFLYHSNSVNSIYLDKFNYEIPALKDGHVVINIGATLNFKSAEANPAGIYSGKYQIIFFYN
jgi:hypothetical protein